MKDEAKPARRRTLTIDKILSVAMDAADQDGLDALSMRKLAALLQVTAMSLYNHVANKEALLDLMLDRVVANVISPDVDGEWEPMMHRRAHSKRETLLRHRWALPLLISRIALGDAVKRDANATVGCLVENGFTYAQADWARNVIDGHIYGYVLQELNFPVEADQYQAAAAHYLPMIDREAYPYMYGAAVEVAEGRYDGIIDFEFGLGLIIDGLKHWKSDAP